MPNDQTNACSLVAKDLGGQLHRTAVNELVPQVGTMIFTAPAREGQRHRTLLPARRSNMDEWKYDWRVLSGPY